MCPTAQSYPQFGWSDPYPVGMGSLGAEPVQIVQSAGSIASSAIPAGMAISHATVFGLSAAMSATIVGAAVAGVTLALVALFSRKGPKQKVATTKIVEQLANAQGTGLMQQNLQGYFAGPRTVSSQAQALANFDAAWQYLLDNCGAESMGDPGKRCISERQRGGVYDMAKDNRDPIANDPDVQPDPTVVEEAGSAVESAVSSLFGTNSSSGNIGLLLLAGAALVLAFSMGGSK